jgi:hypothetical protein
MEDLTSLVSRWASEAIQELPAESPAAVVTAFQAVGGSATSDVVALYAQVGGTQMMDNNHFRLWSLAEIQEENSSPSSYGVLFADYLISCWCYRLKPISKDESEVFVDFFDGSSPLSMGSLYQFLLACVHDPEAVLHHPR